MAMMKTKPTSAGRRSVVRFVSTNLHKGRPVDALISKKSRTGGRNAHGKITTRHIGGGHKQHYRLVDFLRSKDGVPGRVERMEYDPNRSAHLALILYMDGERRYIVATKEMEIGQQIISGVTAPIKPGNALPLKHIPVGTTIHCIEMVPGKGAQIARAAGTSAQLLARDGNYAQIRLRSGEIRRIHSECRATIGEVGNEEHGLCKIGKAGAQRWRGIRPTVRGVAMNPIDHPHGGGEGRTGAGRIPVSPWGTPAKGYRTRSNKRTGAMIVQRRYKR